MQNRRMMKEIPHITMLCALLLFAAGCQLDGGEESLEEELERRAAEGPSRPVLSIGYTHDFDGIEPGEPIRVEADDGADIEIEEAYLVVSAVEVHFCDEDLADGGDRSGRRGAIRRLLLPEAHAHVPSSATRLGIPFVEALHDEQGAKIIGEISPPEGSFCKVATVISPADDDILDLPGITVDDIEGKSLLVRGRRRDDDGDWQAFSSTSSVRRVVDIEAVDPKTGDHPLVLDGPDDRRMLVVDKTISPELFEGLSSDRLEEEAADVVVDRLAEKLELYTHD